MSAAAAVAAALVALALATPPAAPASEPPAAGACEAAAYRGLDFWIGRWRVETPAGQFAGESRIESVLGGCALLEHWRGLYLTTGRVQEGFGVHRYDAATKHWRQAWTDDTPGTSDSTGRQEGDSIVYAGPADAAGPNTRMTLRPLGDGRVEQKGERWDAAAGVWQTGFHLIYLRER